MIPSDTFVAPPRHILLVEAGLGIGGATRCLLSLVDMCTARGWRTSVALAYPLAELEGAGSPCRVIPLYAERAFRRGQRIRRVNDVGPGPRGRTASIAAFLAAVAAADIPVARRLSRYVRRQGVTLIHANNEVLTNRVGILAGRLAGVPVVSHQRGWSGRSWATRLLGQWGDRMVAVSDAVARNLMEVGVPAHKVCRVYDGVDATRFADVPGRREAARGALGFAREDEVVILPAALLPWKGHGLFLEAFARVVGRRPNARALLVGASSVILAGTLGSILGLIAGFYGGLGEAAIMRLADAAYSFPSMLAAILIAGISKHRGVYTVVFALSIIGWVRYARVMHSKVVSVKTREYILAARAMGFSNFRIFDRL